MFNMFLRVNLGNWNITEKYFIMVNLRRFSAEDNLVLVINDQGWNSFYTAGQILLISPKSLIRLLLIVPEFLTVQKMSSEKNLGLH